MRNLCIRGLMLSPFILILFTANLYAQSFVYTDNDTFGANSVTGFSVASNGTLTNIGTFATGGTGGGGGFFASNRARVRMVGNRLYVANDGSNNVSGFDINPSTGALTLVPGSPFSTGGLSGGIGISLDCTPNGQFLIAANTGSNNITVFSVAANGALTPVAGSPFAAGGQPDGVKVTPDGKFLSVALFFNDAIGMFSIAANGVVTPVPGSPFNSPGAGSVAGVEINCAGNLLFAAQANFGGTDVDVFNIAANGTLTLVQSSNNPGVGDNSNVAVLSPNQQFLFVSNQFSNSVTVFSVAANGMLTLVPGSPFGGTGGEPSGVVTNAAGTFLFTANFDNSTVTSFSIGGNGALTLVGNFATGQANFSGLLSLAAFPPASCLTFDVCLQDDSNGNIFQFNSTTGDYIFTRCSTGFTLGGKGTVTIQGSVITLQHNAADRKVLAQIDNAVKKGKASVQVFSLGMTFTIMDRNTANNTCICP